MNLRSGTSYLISAFRSLVVVDDLLIFFSCPSLSSSFVFCLVHFASFFGGSGI
jgi:hypothetical protein